MESGSFITGTIIIVVLLIPFILLYQNTKKRKNKIRRALLDFAVQKKCTIMHCDIWNDTAIGVDEESKNIFFYKKIKDSETSIHVKLQEIQKCRVINNSRVIKNDSGNYTIIDKLALGLTPTDKAVSEIQLEFFNAQSEFSALSDELELCNSWNEVINDCIVEINTMKK